MISTSAKAQHDLLPAGKPVRQSQYFHMPQSLIHVHNCQAVTDQILAAKAGRFCNQSPGHILTVSTKIPLPRVTCASTAWNVKCEWPGIHIHNPFLYPIPSELKRGGTARESLQHAAVTALPVLLQSWQCCRGRYAMEHTQLGSSRLQ